MPDIVIRKHNQTVLFVPQTPLILKTLVISYVARTLLLGFHVMLDTCSTWYFCFMS